MEESVAMKRHSSQLGIWLLAAIALLAGCNKKKQPTVPPQAQAPVISNPPPAAQTGQPIPVNQPPTTAPANQPPATSTATKPKAKAKPKTNHARKGTPVTNPPANKEASAAPTPAPSPAPATTATAGANVPGKTIVHDGGTPDTAPGEILPGMDHNEAAQQRQATERLLQSTDDTLKGISRPLNDDERAMVEQIRNYMTQSRAAATDGDLLRANNLAVKAHLLSDALVKR
jgi:outer membrane biosynthesis protein TonB